MDHTTSTGLLQADNILHHSMHRKIWLLSLQADVSPVHPGASFRSICATCRPDPFDVLELCNQLADEVGEPSSEQLLELNISSAARLS